MQTLKAAVQYSFKHLKYANVHKLSSYKFKCDETPSFMFDITKSG